MINIIKKYKEEAAPKLKEEFNLENDLALPYLEKIVLNASVVDSLSDKGVIEKVKSQLGQISGQMPKITLAKKSISTFKLKEKDPIGVMVTLRGKRSWDFLENFISLVAPRMRDFRGMSNEKFDEKGSYSFGVAEQIIFPQIDYSKIDKPRGLVVTLVIKKSDKQKSKRMLELLGMPFRKEN